MIDFNAMLSRGQDGVLLLRRLACDADDAVEGIVLIVQLGCVQHRDALPKNEQQNDEWTKESLAHQEGGAPSIANQYAAFKKVPRRNR